MDNNLPASAEPNRQRLQPLPVSRDGELVPATPTRAIQELGHCLALVAPTGMSSDDRTEWLRAAQVTLCDIPADLLQRGCEAARRVCDHPSKVVPAILSEIKMAMELRQARRPVTHEEREAQPRLPNPEYVDPAEISALIAKIGNQ